MVFRASAQEIADLLNYSGGKLPKVGCRGIASDLEGVVPGMLFLLDTSLDRSIAEEAFSRGASLVVAKDELEAGNDELEEHLLRVPSPDEAFWTIFRWWRASIKAPIVSVQGGEEFRNICFEVTAYFLLSKRKGSYREAKNGSELSFASSIMSSEEGSEWYLVNLPNELTKLCQELSPTLSLFGEGAESLKDLLANCPPKKALLWDSCSIELPEQVQVSRHAPGAHVTVNYLRDAKVSFISETLSFANWRLPLYRAASLVPLALAVASEIGIHFSDEEISEVASRFYPPPHLGFSMLLGEPGSVWVERALSLRSSDIVPLLTEVAQDKIAILLEQSELKSISAKDLALLSGHPIFCLDSSSAPDDLAADIVRVRSLEEAIEVLLSTPPFFLIAYIKDYKLAESVFHNREQFYGLANPMQIEEEDK